MVINYIVLLIAIVIHNNCNKTTGIALFSIIPEQDSKSDAKDQIQKTDHRKENNHTFAARMEQIVTDMRTMAEFRKVHKQSITSSAQRNLSKIWAKQTNINEMQMRSSQ